MPVEWRDTDAARSGAASHFVELRLWPHRSLDPRGFAFFIGATFLLLLVPLLAVVGTVILWVLLPFMMTALIAIWIALRTHNARAAATHEVLRISRERVLLERFDAAGAVQRWEADPYWVSVQLHPAGGPVENYITLKGNGREVEIGAFLSSEERLALCDDLKGALMRARSFGD